MLINLNGAVSEKVAVAMAEGALKNSLADISIAVTGVAGTSALGSETVTGGATASVTGVVGTGNIGVSLVWGDIDTSQTANYQDLTTTQVPNWQIVNTSQTSTWEIISGF